MLRGMSWHRPWPGIVNDWQALGPQSVMLHRDLAVIQDNQLGLIADVLNTAV